MGHKKGYIMTITTSESCSYQLLAQRAEAALLYHAPKVRITTAFKAQLILDRGGQQWGNLYVSGDLISRRSTVMEQVRRVIAVFAENHPLDPSAANQSSLKLDLVLRYRNHKYQWFHITVTGDDTHEKASALLSAKEMAAYYQSHMEAREGESMELFDRRGRFLAS